MSTLMSVQEALSICGSLSEPGKMPGRAYSLSAEQCRIGGLLQHIPKAVCAHCYALRGRYRFRKVIAAMKRRTKGLSDPRWVDAVTTLIRSSRSRYFRWHDSGDLQGPEHFQKIVAVCRKLPRVKFWLPTREYQTVEAYRRTGGVIPRNLCVRYSAHLIDGPPPLSYGLPVSTVSSKGAAMLGGVYRCQAAEHGNRCGECRACWDHRVRIVDFPLKWPAPFIGG